MRPISWTAILLALASVPAPPALAQADDVPRVALEALGGAATFGRFLEQRTPGLGLPGGQTGERELTARPSFALAGALNVRVWEQTSLRLGATWASTDFEFGEDSGFGGDARDRDDVRGVSVLAASASLLRPFGPEDAPVRPYGVAGLAGGWWTLDEATGTPDVISGGEETLFRMGLVTGIGLQVMASETVLVRLEANRITTGNPFDGAEAFRAPGGENLDEPDTAGLTRFGLGLAIGLGG